MLDVPQLDPMGSLLAELRADIHVDDLTDGRVRGFEPRGATHTGGVQTYEGDALGPGSYKAFVVVVALDVPIHPSLPITFADYALRCYGATHQNAWAVWGAVAKALHAVGPRVKASGIGFYRSAVLSGGTQDTDPDTGQPVVTGTLSLIATAVDVTAAS